MKGSGDRHGNGEGDGLERGVQAADEPQTDSSAIGELDETQGQGI